MPRAHINTYFLACKERRKRKKKRGGEQTRHRTRRYVQISREHDTRRTKEKVPTLNIFKKSKVKMNFDDVPVVRNEKKFDDIVQAALKGGDPQLIVPPKSIAKDVLKETTGNVYVMNSEQNAMTGTTTTVDSPMVAKNTPALISSVNNNKNDNTSTDSPKRPFLKKGTGVKRIYTPPKDRISPSPSPLASYSQKAEQQVVVKDKTKMTAWEVEEYEMQQEVANFESLENAIKRKASKGSIERAAEEFVQNRQNDREMRSQDPLSYPYASKHAQETTEKATAEKAVATSSSGVAAFAQTNSDDNRKPASVKHRSTSPAATSTPLRGSVQISPMPPSSSQRINELARSSMSPSVVNRSAIKRQENARKALDKDRAELEKDMNNFKKQMMKFKEQKDEFANHMKRERLLLEQKERSILGQSRTEREEIKLLRGEIEKMKEDQKYRDQKSKLTVDRLRKQVENLSQEAGALKLEKERMSEEMRQMKTAQRVSTTKMPGKTEAIISKPVKASPMFAKASPPPVYINASPEAQEVKDMFVKEEEEEVEEHIYEEEKVPDELLRVPNIAPAPIWNNVAETGFSEDVHADGKITRKYMDGTRVTKFYNKNSFRVESGSSLTMYYDNGDIKKTVSDANMHVVRYFYSSAGTWQSNFKIGKRLSGQSEKERATKFEYSIFHYMDVNEVEVEYQSKIKDVYKDNGEILRIYPDDNRQEVIGCK